MEAENDKKNNTYHSHLCIPSFSSSSFDWLYLSHSAVIFSSKPPKVMNVTTTAGHSWIARQVTPQSGCKDPVINASYYNQLNINMHQKSPDVLKPAYQLIQFILT